MNTIFKKGLSLGLTVLLLIMSVPFVSFAEGDFDFTVTTTDNSATLSFVEKADATYAVTPSAGTYDSGTKTITGLSAQQSYSVTVVETITKSIVFDNNTPISKVDNQNFYTIYDGFKITFGSNDVIKNGTDYPELKKGTYTATKSTNKTVGFETTSIPTYTVTFKIENAIVGTDEVLRGSAAEAPAVETRAGFTFAWNREFNDVQSDFEVIGTYTANNGPVTPTQYTITLNVQPGGTAFINVYENVNEFKGRLEPYTIQYDSNTKLEISSFSNAGYAYKGFLVGSTPTTGRTLTHTVVADASITVQFINVSNVFNMPSYVIDGGFSGYHANGNDISLHDPQNDVLNAELKSEADKTLYIAGETAIISLPVTVKDGDNDTLVLKEVTYYQDGVKILDAAEAPATPVTTAEYKIPNTVSGLLAAGFSFNPATNYFNKTLTYALVDIYDGDDAAAIISTSQVTLSVKYNATIYMTVDNAYELYINGVLQTPVFVPTPPSYPWQSIKWFDAVLNEGDVVAVKGTDEGGIAGFLADIIYNGKTYSTTSESFWRQSLVAETGWNNKGFIPTANWTKTTDHGSTAWTGLTGLPSGLPSTWVWSSDNSNHNVVYFRYVVGGANIDAPVVPGNTPPTIELIGAATINLTVGDTYNELGATATDKEDGTLEVKIDKTVDTSKDGTTIITYSAVDKNNSSVSITRTVIVSPKAVVNTPPTIELVGAATINLTVGDTYNELGATATDKEDGKLEVKISKKVDTSKAGTTVITYTAIDKNEATVTVTRTIIVAPKTIIIETPDTNEDTDQDQPVQPATQPATVDVPDEAIAEGDFSMMNFDSFLGGTTTPAEETTEALETVDVDEELTPQGAATTLPQTGQLPVELFYSVGGLITAAGVFLKKKN